MLHKWQHNLELLVSAGFHGVFLLGIVNSFLDQSMVLGWTYQKTQRRMTKMTCQRRYDFVIFRQSYVLGPAAENAPRTVLIWYTSALPSVGM